MPINFFSTNKNYFGANPRHIPFGYTFSPNSISDRPNRAGQDSGIVLPNGLNGEINTALGFQNDGDSRTKGEITASVGKEVSSEDSEKKIYEITVTVERTGKARGTTGVIAYAGEDEIMTDGKVDTAKLEKIKNDVINCVRDQ